MQSAERLIDIFNDAKARPAGPEREKAIQEACGTDRELRAQIISLLEAESGAGDFLQNQTFTPVVTEKPGDMIGPYKLRELLGEGGCGVVYVADQEAPIRRRVALKVIKLGMDTRAVVARFEAERQALAMMDHPNIAKVFDAGATSTGRPYFVMELVRGTPITEYCDENHLSTQERLDLFVQVCQAIQHAHHKGVIHRDIKPSNILITLHDGVAVPKVIDFGIAKATEGRLSEATIYTQLHQLLGTPAYMSPEQVEMSGLDIDTRSDIYSLGVLLYELLAGRTPFDGEALISQGLDVMRKTICEREPIPPSTRLARLPEEERTRTARRQSTEAPRLVHTVRGDLDWIVMKCLEKDRTRRYESASGLAADLKRHLNCEPIQARPPSNLYRLQKTFRRHKIAFAAIVAVALSLVLGLVASLWLNVIASRARREAERRSYVFKMNLARQAWEDNNLGRLKQLLADTANDPHRGFEWYYWQRQIHLDLLTLRGHTAAVSDVAYSPDGSRILTASYDKTARIWDATNGLTERVFEGHSDGVASAAWSSNGTRIVTASWDHTAKVWDALRGRVLFTLHGHTEGLNSARFSPDGGRIVTTSWDKTARVWDAETGAELLVLPHDYYVWSAVFSPDGQKIATGTANEWLTLWDKEGRKLWSLQVPMGRAESRRGQRMNPLGVSFSPDGQSVATVTQDQAARVWDAISGQEKFDLQKSSFTSSPRQRELPVFTLFSPDARRLVIGGLDSTASIWDVGRRTNLFLLKGHEAEITSASFSPDGARIVTGSRDMTAKIWMAERSIETRELPGHSAIVPFSAFSTDGARILTGSWDGAAVIWQIATGERLRTLDHGTNWVWSGAFSPDGTRVVTGTQDGTFHVWDAFTGRELLSVLAHPHEVHPALFSPDGKTILTAGPDYTAKLWDASTGRQIFVFKVNQFVASASFSPDGIRIATTCDDNDQNTLEDGVASVWDARTGQKLFDLEKYLGGISRVVFSPDGRRLAGGSLDGTVIVWDASTGRQLMPLHGHKAQVIPVFFTPDSTRIVTSGFDLTTRVWDAVHGDELLTLKGIMASDISPDGLRLCTAGFPPVQIWEIASREQVQKWQLEENPHQP